MFNFRIIPRLDIKNGLLIKGINLEGLRVLGDPLNFAKKYYEHGADEISYIDVVSSLYGTKNISKFVKNTAKNNFIPLTVGGGICNINDILEMLNNGADKICINTGIVNNPKLLNDAAKKFGSSTIVALVEIVKIDNNFFLTTNNGRELIFKNSFEWIRKIQDDGAGEIVVTLVNNEGLQNGFDKSLANKLSKIIKIPFLLHGGFGKPEHILNIAKNSSASGILISSMLHYNYMHNFMINKIKLGNDEYLKNNILKKFKEKNIIYKIKKFLKKNNINVRL